MKIEKAESALLKARVSLLLKWPLIGQVILNLEIKEVEWCATAATDGRYFYFNRAFIESLEQDEVLWLSGHETLHAVFDHVFRRGQRDKMLFNMACDYLVDDVLAKTKIGKMIDGALLDPKYTDTYTAEEIYEMLQKDQPERQEPIDMHLDDPKEDDDQPQQDGPPRYSEQELEEIRETMRSALLQGAAQTTDVGKLPKGIRRMLDRLLQPKIDWRQMLDAVVRSSISHDYTYYRMSRRSYGSGFVLPGQDIEDRVEVVAFLDGSASTTKEMITDFLTECKGIVTSFRDFKLTVGTFDTKVYNVVDYTPENADEIDNYDFHGGGGTQPSCCWDHMREHEIEPHRLLMFTDGDVGGDWGDADYCDTLFIIHSNPGITASHGLTAHYP